jgi:hypothetical protein
MKLGDHETYQAILDGLKLVNNASRVSVQATGTNTFMVRIGTSLEKSIRFPIVAGTSPEQVETIIRTKMDDLKTLIV